MSRFYRVFLYPRIVFLAVFLVFLAGTQAKAASPLFTINDVKVDVTAENALKAREQAFEQAQSIAFKILTERMVSEDQQVSFTDTDIQTISTLINDFEVTKEQLSSVRYVGTYTFRFRDSAVKNFFSQAGARYTDVSSKPILVLPFYQAEGKTLLWSPFNHWMAAWRRAENLESGLVPLTVPLGDLADVSDIGEKDALEYDERKLTKMLRRYDAGEAVLLIATPDTNLSLAKNETSRANGRISVFMYRTDRQGPEFVQDFSLSGNGGSVAALMDRSVQKVRSALRKNWKKKTVVDSGRPNRLQVRVKYKGLQQWSETQKAMRRVYGLQDLEIVSVTPREAKVDLIYQGTEKRLRLALKQADMILTAPRISAGAITNARYNARYGGYEDMRAPLVYDLYLNKYAPDGIRPIHARSYSDVEPHAGDTEDGNPQAGGKNWEWGTNLPGRYRKYQ